MKEKRVILFRCISLALVFLLLFLAAGGNAVTQAHTLTKVAKTEKALTPGKSIPAEAQLSAAPADAVVTPAVSFDFGQSIFLIPQPIVLLFLLLTVAILRQFMLPHYFFSYLRHVFGHYIAPNAP